MPTKTSHLQIRVTPQQKAALERSARRAGRTLSAYVLGRLLPAPRLRFEEILRELRDAGEASFGLAALHDLLDGLAPAAFSDAVGDAEIGDLTPFLQNYVAAMVEQAAQKKGVLPPAWVRKVAPLEEPRFATSLRSLRLHLLTAAPIPFRRRNIFVDSGLGDRV